MNLRFYIVGFLLCAGILASTCVSVPKTVPAPGGLDSVTRPGDVIPSWDSLVMAPECRRHHAYMTGLFQTYETLRTHLLGIWLLCATSSRDQLVAEQLAARLQQQPGLDAAWQDVVAWSTWLGTSGAPLPARLPQLAETVVPRLAIAATRMPQRQTEAVELYRRFPHWWNWQKDDRARIMQYLTDDMRREVARTLTRHGLREVAWAHLRPIWEAAGAQPAELQHWWPEANALDRFWLADLAFSLRHYAAAETIAAALAGKGEQLGPALLLWGRALARQGRSDEATRLWLRERDRVRRTVHWMRITYRLGLLAEDRHDFAAASTYFRAAAIAPFPHEERDHAGFLTGWRAYQQNDYKQAAAHWHEELDRTEEHVARRRLLYWLHRVNGDTPVRDALFQEAPLSFYAWLYQRVAQAPITMPVTWTTYVDSSDISVHASFSQVRELSQLKLYPVAQLAFSRAVTEADSDAERIALLQMGADANVAHLALTTFWQYYYNEFRVNAPELHKDLWKIVYPRPYREQIDAAAERFGVDAALLYAIMREESRFRADIISPAGAIGLLQLMPATALQTASRYDLPYGGTDTLVDPGVNIPIAAAYIRQMLDTYEGELLYAVGAYNAGPNAINTWRRRFAGLELDAFSEEIPYTETRRYVAKVIRSYVRYQMLYGAGDD